MTENRSSLIVAILFLLVCAALGGASRADEFAQLIIRLLAIILAVIALWRPRPGLLREARTAMWFMAACVALVAAQLVPLPYGLWASLPGHGFYASYAESLGLAPVWRPMSLTPDLTLNTLLSLLVPIAALAIALSLPHERRHLLVLPLLGVIVAAAVLGMLQLAGGESSPLRLYSITNRSSMVGVFANRNHHAVMLATGLPLLGIIAAVSREHRRWSRIAPVVCLLTGVVLILSLLLIGSRAGLLLGALGTVLGLGLHSAMTNAARAPSARAGIGRRLLIPGALVTVPAAAVWLAIASGRAPAVERLVATRGDELRADLLQPMLEMLRTFMPLGSGFGSFDPVFRRFEPMAQLRLTYLNEAHNDLLQLAIEGGVPALLLLAAFLLWWSKGTIRAWRAPMRNTLPDALPRIGTIVTGFLLVASLGDYPLRTPLHAALFVFGCVWMASAPRRLHVSGAPPIRPVAPPPGTG